MPRTAEARVPAPTAPHFGRSWRVLHHEAFAALLVHGGDALDGCDAHPGFAAFAWPWLAGPPGCPSCRGQLETLASYRLSPAPALCGVCTKLRWLAPAGSNPTPCRSCVKRLEAGPLHRLAVGRCPACPLTVYLEERDL